MIEGSFRDVSLPALLQLLCFETNKSFRIRVTAENQKGYILVRRGWVIAAKFGILEGEDAICEFLSWNESSFLAEQVVAQTDVEKNLRFDLQPNPGFIQDCKLLNDQNIGLNSEITGSQIFGSPEWKLLVKEHPLDRECFSVLAWLREGRKMRQALREFGFDVVRATAILAMLVRTQSIQVIRPGTVFNEGDGEVHVAYHLVSTTGGQQEAAAALAKEAARALEPDEVVEEGFMSTSFRVPAPKAAERNAVAESITQANTQSQSQSQAASLAADFTQVRSSMEARLRAKKNLFSLSGTDMPAYSEKAASEAQAQKEAQKAEAALGAGGEKKVRPDLSTVLQNQPHRVVDLGESKPGAHAGQQTSSTHDIGALKPGRQGQADSSPVKKNGDQPANDSLKDIIRNEAERANGSPVVSQVESSSPFAKLSTKNDLESKGTSATASGLADVSSMSANWPKKENLAATTTSEIAQETRSSPIPGATPEVKPELTAQANAQIMPDSKLEPKPAPKPEIKVEQSVQPQPKPEVQPKPQPAPKPIVAPVAAAPKVPPPAPAPAPPSAPPPAAAPRPAAPEKDSAPPSPLAADDRRFIAKTQAMPLVAFDIERLLLTTFLATQFGKLALGNPSLDPNRRQTLLDAEYGKSLAFAIDERTRSPAAVLASYRYCLDRGYIETHDPVIPLTADLLLGRMEIDQYLLQRRRITGDELRDLIKIAREEGIKLTQLLVKSGYLTEADLEALSREQKRFAFK